MRLLCLGDNVVDRYVAQGVMYPGGNAVNVAVFAKRLGADAAYQGVLGSDEAGRLVLASLVGEGVDTSRVTVAQGPNAWADVELVEGDRLFLGSDKGVSNFRLTATHYAEVAAFDAVHTAYTALLEDQLFDLCTHAARVSYDFGRNFTPEQVGRLTPGLWLASFSGSHLSEREVSHLLRASCASGWLTLWAPGMPSSQRSSWGSVQATTPLRRWTMPARSRKESLPAQVPSDTGRRSHACQR